MKKELVFNNNITPLTPDECSITGGGDITNFLRCVSHTMTGGGGGGIRSFVLGPTVFGLARLIGVAVGCANL